MRGAISLESGALGRVFAPILVEVTSGRRKRSRFVSHAILLLLDLRAEPSQIGSLCIEHLSRCGKFGALPVDSCCLLRKNGR